MHLNNRRDDRRILTVTSFAFLIMLVLSIGTVSGADDFKLTAENNFDGNVRLSWTWVDDIRVDHYNIYWDTEEFDSIEGKQVKSGERGNTFMVLDLEDGETYYFVVTAVNSTGFIIAQDNTDAEILLPHLKEINFWNLMAVFILTSIVFVFVIIKIPTWSKAKSGGM